MQIFGFQKEIVSVITSIIIYFSAFSLFMRHGIERLLLKGKTKDANELEEENT